MDGEGKNPITYTEWDEHIIGLISGPDFDGEREVRAKTTGSQKVFAECYIGPSSNPESIRSELLLPLDTSAIAMRLLGDMQQLLPTHSVRAHSAAQPSDLRPFPQGPGEHGVSLTEDHKERMWAQSGAFVSLSVARRGWMGVNHGRLQEALATGDELAISIAENAIRGDKTEYLEFVRRMKEQIDLLSDFAAAELAMAESAAAEVPVHT